ncbi:hypothetical protein QBC41DRAFT_68675 [Cercophora samala]|uniref:Uncharacterized protein n=1 Tax=Cercophora samala TaxID=330535 RepID=A0AA40DBM1_9PEZI|nr:hypothetical protein QBC41DRAFT_68675 [Cercophora samala]
MKSMHRLGGSFICICGGGLQNGFSFSPKVCDTSNRVFSSSGRRQQSATKKGMRFLFYQRSYGIGGGQAPGLFVSSLFAFQAFFSFSTPPFFMLSIGTMCYQKSFCPSPPSSYYPYFLRRLQISLRSRLLLLVPLGTALHSYDTSLLAGFWGKVGWQEFSVVGRGEGWEGVFHDEDEWMEVKYGRDDGKRDGWFAGRQRKIANGRENSFLLSSCFYMW